MIKGGRTRRYYARLVIKNRLTAGGQAAMTRDLGKIGQREYRYCLNLLCVYGEKLRFWQLGQLR